MRTLYSVILVGHVLVAILGLGSIAAVSVVAATARRAGHRSADALKWFHPLLRYSTFSLGGMLVTGALLDLVVGGAFNEKWWFRGSALLLVATGVLLARARRAVRAGLANADEGDAAVRRVERMTYGICALVAATTVLMEVKPF